MSDYFMNEAEENDVRFADPQEIADSTCHIKWGKKNHGAGMLVRSNTRELDVDSSDTHSLIIGETGGGKSRRQVIPMIHTMIEAGESIIVNDCKGEIYRYLHNELKRNKYKEYVLNFREPLAGNQYNLLSIGANLYEEGKKSEATEYFYSFANSIYEPLQNAEDPFWTQESARYLTGLCLLACELMDAQEVNLANVYNLHVMGMERVGPATVLSCYFTEKRKASAIWRLMEGTLNAPNDTRTSILSVMSQGLFRLILNEDIVDMTSENDFEVRDIAREKTIVFLMTKDETSAYDSIVTAFIDQSYTALVGMAETEYGGKLPIRVEYVLDEFANMACLNDMTKKITASRSRNIRWHLVIQSLQQLSVVYGKDNAETIIGNCGTWCYMNTSDINLLRSVSELCGEIEEDSGKRRRLLSISQLQHFSKMDGECLILLGRNRPFVTYLPDLSEYERLAECQYSCPKRTRKKKPLYDIKSAVRKERESMALRAKKETQSNGMTFTEFMELNAKEKEEVRKEIDKKLTEEKKQTEPNEKELPEPDKKEGGKIQPVNESRKNAGQPYGIHALY